MLILAACEDDPLGPDGWGSVSKDGFHFRWKISGGSIEIELTAPTTGWIMIGFKGEYQMHDANIIVGYVSGGSVSVRDDFGIDSDTHVSDSNLHGGQQNATDAGGDESSGSTTISFTIPLDSGDTWDNVLVDGESTRLMFARGADGADDFDSDWAFITNTTVTL